MTSSIQSHDIAHVYQGEAKIVFKSNEHGLTVTIDTKRLHLRSVQASEKEYDRYASLFGDPQVMEKYATGVTKTRDQIKERIQKVWDQRWHGKDPYAGFAVFLKGTDTFIGHVVLGHNNASGVAELAFLFHKAYWRQGYGTEAVTPLVKEYAPATLKEGYLLEGKPLEKIVATARLDHPAGNRILEKIGMHIECVNEKFGAQRNHYAISMSQLQDKV